MSPEFGPARLRRQKRAPAKPITKKPPKLSAAKKKAALQAAAPKLPNALIAADMATRVEAGLPAARGAHAVRLLNRHEVLAFAGCSYPTLWAWMRAGKFPRSRILGGKSMWLSTEIDEWLANLPVRPLKGDTEPLPHSTSDGAQLNGDAVDICVEETASRPGALKTGNQIIVDPD
jgi:predicted DNA-binding transcriptional regulator AlpA